MAIPIAWPKARQTVNVETAKAILALLEEAWIAKAHTGEENAGTVAAYEIELDP